MQPSSKWSLFVAPLFAVGWCCVADAAVAADTDLTNRVDQLIGQLNDNSYTVREKASTQLETIGFPARQQLREATRSPHPEVRARSRRLLVLIEEGDFRHRLEQFAADTDGSSGFSLPGWEVYRRAIGDDASARSLFVEMQKHVPRLLRDAFANEGSSEQLLQQLDQRVIQLINWQNSHNAYQPQVAQRAAPLGTSAAVLFMGTEFGDDLPANISVRLGRLTQQPPISNAASSGRYSEQVRKLLTNWVLHSNNVSSSTIDQKLQVVCTQKLTSAKPFVLDLVRGKVKVPGLQASHRARAALALGIVDSQFPLEELIPTLGDEEVCFHFAGQEVSGKHIPPITVQLRDVVLAVLIHRTGQELQNYGFSQAKRDSNWMFRLNSLGFQRPEQRESAFAKWEVWLGKSVEGG